MTESWEIPPGLDDYLISSLGRVMRGAALVKPTVKRSRNGKPSVLVIGIQRSVGRTRTKAVHHMVLEAFVGPRPAGLVGCHRDGDIFNNAVGNLRWDTQLSNIHDAISHGTFVNAPGFEEGSQRGAGNFQAKLTADLVLEIRAKIAGGERRVDLGAEYGLHPAYVSLIASRRRWGWLPDVSMSQDLEVVS